MTFDHLRPLRWVIVLVCLALSARGQEAKGGDEEALAVVRDRHRAAREGIRTLSADVTIEITFPEKKLFMRGKYWRSLGTVRVQEFPPGTDNIEEHLLKDGEIRSVGRHRLPDGRYDRHGAGRDSAATLLAMCDVWREMLLDFSSPSVTRYDYDRFLALAKRPPTARREKSDGVDCVRVSMTVSADDGIEWAYTFWHDIERNYLIRKMTMDVGKGDTTSEYEITEFREAVPGVFVPLRCLVRVSDQGKLRQECSTTLSNVRVNEPMAKDVFTLPAVPAGTVLHDGIDGTRYPIDENWRAIGPKAANPRVMLPTRSDGPGSEYRAQTEEEPRPLSRWLAPGSVGVLGVAAGVWVYRRRRRRPDAA